MDPVFDVAILGYGPVGAVLANLLGSSGLNVAVVERAAEIFDKPRASSIDHEALRVLQSFGLAAAVERIGSHHTGTEFRGIAGDLIKVFAPPRPPFPLGWVTTLIIIQPEFERLLRKSLARWANVEVLLGRQAVALAQDENEVRLSIVDNEAKTHLIRSKYLVACDGAASWTRNALDILQNSLDFDEWWLVVDGWIKQDLDIPKCTTQFCDPSAPASFVVGPRGFRRWEMKLLPHETPAHFQDNATIRKRLSQFVNPEDVDIWRVATYRFHALVAQDWRRGRSLLAGDAAHQMPPFMAQGLCSGIRDANNLSWKLKAVLRDRVSDTVLDSYSLERKPHILAIANMAKELGQIIGELDPSKAQERDEVLRRQLRSGEAQTSRHKLIPDLTAGIIATDPDGKVSRAAGALLPQPRVRAVGGGHAVLLDDLVGSRFLIITIEADPPMRLGPHAAAVWRRLSGLHLQLTSGAKGDHENVGIVEEGEILRTWMGEVRSSAVIIRPDKYLFAGAADPETLNRQVIELGEKLFGGGLSGHGV